MQLLRFAAAVSAAACIANAFHSAAAGALTFGSFGVVGALLLRRSVDARIG